MSAAACGKSDSHKASRASETPFVMIPARVLASVSLSSPAKLAYAVVLDHANSDGVSRVGARRIAERTGTAVSTVLRAIVDLEDAGEVTVERGKSGQRHVYRLAPPPTNKRSQNESASYVENRSRNASATCNPKRSQDGAQRSRSASASARRMDHVQKDLLPDVCAAPSARSRKSKTTKPTGPVGAVLRAYGDRWSARYAGTYRPEDRGRDARLLQRVLADCDGAVDEVTARLDRFFEIEGGWLAEHRHPLTTFAKQHRRHATPRETNSVSKNNRAPIGPLIVADACAKWPADFEAHADVYRAIAAVAESGRIPLDAVVCFAGDGPAFRAEHAEEVRRAG